jgi:flagellar biogenesis protein FliO
MREMLEPIFGESGAVVAQFVITLIVVLILIGLLYWLVQRFSGLRFPSAGRGRVPRLAIIDALSVDGRRKLVLVRRDNVEHLILIGGTSDLVVEPSIVRGAAVARPRQGQPQRPQPQAQPQSQQSATAAAAAALQVAPQPQPAPQRAAETSGISEPIPFPPQRPQPRATPRAAETPTPERIERPERPMQATAPEPAPQRRAAVRAAAAPEPMAAAAAAHAASARFEEPSRPSRIESVFSLADALDEIANEPMTTNDAAEFAGPKARPSAPARHYEEAATLAAEASDEPTSEGFDISPEPAPAIATDDTAEPDAPQEGQQPSNAAKVSDLEREMARLLGEITSRRES